VSAKSGSQDVRGACPLDCPDTCGWVVASVAIEWSHSEATAIIRTHGVPSAIRSRTNLLAAASRSPDAAHRRQGHEQLHTHLVGRCARDDRRKIDRHDRAVWRRSAPALHRQRQHGPAAGGLQRWPALLECARCVASRANNLHDRRRVRTGYTLGDNRVGMDPETSRDSKLIVLWSANVLSTHPHLWRHVLEARKNGCRCRHRPDPDPYSGLVRSAWCLNYPEPFVPFQNAFPDAVGKARIRVGADGHGRVRSSRRLHASARVGPARHTVRARVPARARHTGRIYGQGDGPLGASGGSEAEFYSSWQTRRE
jgi:hypothetical protein